MSQETNILQFIFGARDAGLTALADKVSAKLAGIHKAAHGMATQFKAGGIFEAIFGNPAKLAAAGGSAGVGMLAKSFKTVVSVVDELTERYIEFQIQNVKLRRELQLNTGAATNFGNQMLEGSARYGVALNKIQGLASIIATGTNQARKNAVEMAASLANLSRQTGTSEEMTQEWARTMTKSTGQAMFGTINATKSMFALAESARVNNMTTDEMASSVLSLSKNLYEMKERAPSLTRQFVDMAGAFNMTGGSVENASAMMRAITTEGTNANRMAKSFGYDMKRLSEEIAQQVSKTDASSGALARIGEQYGLSASQALDFANASKQMGKSQDTFTKALSMSDDQIEQTQTSRMGAFEKLSFSVKKMEGTIFKVFSGMADKIKYALEPVADFLSKTIDTWADIFTKDGYNKILDALEFMWEGITQGMKSSFSSLFEKLSGLLSPSNVARLLMGDINWSEYIEDAFKTSVQRQGEITKWKSMMGKKQTELRSSYNTGATAVGGVGNDTSMNQVNTQGLKDLKQATDSSGQKQIEASKDLGRKLDALNQNMERSVQLQLQQMQSDGVDNGKYIPVVTPGVNNLLYGGAR